MYGSMNDITPYVVKKLARSADRDDLVYWVCQQRGLGWQEAEALIDEIEDRHSEEIRRRKSPLLLILSGLLAMAGLVWALISFAGIVFPIWQIYRDSGGWVDAAAWLGIFWMLFPQLLAGSGLAIGGIFGVISVIKKRDQVDWVVLEENEQ